MEPLRIRTFQGRIFLAILAVVLIPAAITVAAGALTLRGIGENSGTLGAWDSVAESGRDLIQLVDSAQVADSALQAAADAHGAALSESVRLSRLYAFVAERFLEILPLAALAVGLFIAGLALFTARWLSTGFAGPVAELVGWTQRIAREEPLPEAEPAEATDVDEIQALRTALRQMADDLEEGRQQTMDAVRMRSWADLARRVAHEIKNPLTPMRMAAEALGRDRTGAQAEAAGVLLDEIERLDGMARTFAQFGRMPEGPKSEVDVRELLESLASQHSSGDLPVTVVGDEGVRLEAQLDALERAVRNLLLNALEALDAGGHVTMSATSREGVVDITVSDDGPGIPEDVIEDIWRPDVTTKRQGTGLGLAIVRQTVAAHGGTVHAQNRPGGGAVFTLTIPQAPHPT
jgi:signal transduction histidine kinase